MTESSIQQRAAEQTAFAHRVARIVFELEETATIVDVWKRFAEERRAHVATAASRLSEALIERERELDDTGRDPESDRLGSFEIQDLISDYNAAETLASQILKKLDRTTAGIIQKI